MYLTQNLVRRSKRRITAAIAVAAATLLVATGCTPGDDDGGGDDGGILRIGVTDYIASFNPVLGQTPLSGILTSTVFPTLAQQNYVDGVWEMEPSLAESWSQSDDGKQVTFILREGAKWSDGEPMTADDVAWTINTGVKFKDGPLGAGASSIEGITEATAVDPTTVVVDYDYPRADAIDALTGRFMIMPEHVWAPAAEGDGEGLSTFQPDQAEGGMVSGGPFLLKEFDQHGTTVFVRNPDFYGTPAKAEAVTITSYTNEAAMVQAFEAGQVDYIIGFPSSALPSVEDIPGTTVDTAPSFFHAVFMSNANPAKDTNRELLIPEVKTALNMCIDRDEIIDVVFRGQAEKVESWIGTAVGEYYNDELSTPYDCDAANAALDELGYERGPDGIRVVPATTGEYAQPAHPMSYEIVTPNGAPFDLDRSSAIVKTSLEELGVEVNQNILGDVPTTWTATMGADCSSEDGTGYQGWDFWLDLDVSNPTPWPALHNPTQSSWCSWNLNGYLNPQYDAGFEAATKELDEAARIQAVKDLQKIYFDSGSEFVLAEMLKFAAHNDKWDGFASPLVFEGFTNTFLTAPHQK